MRPHSLLFAGILAGCTSDRPNATSDSADYVSATSDRCSAEGQARDCRFVFNKTPTHEDCFIGTQKCGPTLRWGPCERPDFAMTSTGASNAEASEAFSGAPDSDDSECPVEAPALDGPVVEIVAVNGNRPAAEGGHVVPGAYVLTSSEIFANELVSRPTGTFVQRAVVVTSDHFAFTEASAGETAAHVFWFGTNGKAFGYEQTCPRSSEVVAIEYTAHGNELILFPTAHHREVLTRKP